MKGRYGIHGGQYIPETLMSEIHKIEEAYEFYKNDPAFNDELNTLLKEYAGRPSLLYYAKKMTEDLGGAKIYLKREDLNHTGSHKINNVLGQALMAKKMGKTRIIAETGAGQHGVATATVAALLGLECEIFMGKEDTDRQALNVYRMELLGAKVHPVTTGTMTLKDAVNEAMREWTKRVDDTMYVLGSVMGPHPFPMMVRDFQSVISKEAREQILEYEGKLPTAFISAGLDYPGIGPDHAYLHDTKRAQYVPVTDDEAVDAFEYIAKTEGIICAIESAHAIAHAIKIAPTMKKDDILIVCLSGRGDKDVAAIARYRGKEIYE